MLLNVPLIWPPASWTSVISAPLVGAAASDTVRAAPVIDTPASPDVPPLPVMIGTPA